MAETIEIRDVPDAVLRRLEAQAARTGLRLSDYLRAELARIAERPTLDEMRGRLEGRPEVTLSITPSEAVRAERDRR